MSDSDDYPILDDDRRIQLFDENGDRTQTLIILGLWVDEDGITQVRINDTWTRKLTLTVDDIHERIDEAGSYEVHKNDILKKI